MSTAYATTNTPPVVISPQNLIEHWQGHRRLTRRVIDAFPEDKLFNYSVGGMRPAAELAIECIEMGVPSLKGAATGKWQSLDELEQASKKGKISTKQELLEYWDQATETLNTLWSQIPAQRFQEVEVAFGMWEAPIYKTILYCIENEIHHRGQAYVYLRSLGITPPPFWERD